MQIPSLDIILSWPKANYVNPITRGSGMTVSNSILFPVMLAIVTIRIYTRLRISKSYGWDDTFIIAAMVPATGFMIIGFIDIEIYDGNLHVWDTPGSVLSDGLKLTIASQILYMWASTLNKISMLILTCRILAQGNSIVRVIAKIVIAIATIHTILYSSLVVFQCNPISLFWTLSAEPQNCMERRVILLFFGTLNTITDFIAVTLPIPVVLKLQLPRRQQVIVCLLFAAGGFVVIAGAVRTYYTDVLTDSTDPTWDVYPVWICSTFELYVGIIGASIPVTKPWFMLYIPRLISSSKFLTNTLSKFTSRVSHSTGASATGKSFASSRANDNIKSAEEGMSPTHRTRSVAYQMVPPRQSSLRAKGPHSPRPDYRIASSQRSTRDRASLPNTAANTEDEKRGFPDDSSSISSFRVSFPEAGSSADKTMDYSQYRPSTQQSGATDETYDMDIQRAASNRALINESPTPGDRIKIKKEFEIVEAQREAHAEQADGRHDGLAVRGEGDTVWMRTHIYRT